MTGRDSVFARKLRGLRGEHDMSQEDLATAVGSSIASVQNWEKGETMPTLRTSIKIADLFNVSLDLLVGRSPQEVS